jgi:hypothetical protein
MVDLADLIKALGDDLAILELVAAKGSKRAT